MFGNSQIGKDGSEPLLMNYANMANQFQCLSNCRAGCCHCCIVYSDMLQYTILYYIPYCTRIQYHLYITYYDLWSFAVRFWTWWPFWKFLLCVGAISPDSVDARPAIFGKHPVSWETQVPQQIKHSEMISASSSYLVYSRRGIAGCP